MSVLYPYAQTPSSVFVIWEVVYLKVWWLYTWCVYMWDSVFVKVHSLSLRLHHSRVGMLRQTHSLFLGQWQCVNGRRCIAKEGSEIPTDPGLSQLLTLFAHSPCPLSSQTLTSLSYMVVWCVVCCLVLIFFAVLWFILFHSFEIMVWGDIMNFCMTWHISLAAVKPWLSQWVQRWKA